MSDIDRERLRQARLRSGQHSDSARGKHQPVDCVDRLEAEAAALDEEISRLQTALQTLGRRREDVRQTRDLLRGMSREGLLPINQNFDGFEPDPHIPGNALDQRMMMLGCQVNRAFAELVKGREIRGKLQELGEQIEACSAILQKAMESDRDGHRGDDHENGIDRAA